MYILTDVDYSICRTQKDIYYEMANRGYDMNVFSKEYLKSNFCKRAMDTTYSRFQWADELECLDFILPEIENKLVKIKNPDLIFNPEISAWIGFMYRALYISTKINSSILTDKIPFSIMWSLYPGFHTIDEDEAISIISEEYLKRE